MRNAHGHDTSNKANKHLTVSIAYKQQRCQRPRTIQRTHEFAIHHDNVPLKVSLTKS